MVCIDSLHQRLVVAYFTLKVVVNCINHFRWWLMTTEYIFQVIDKDSKLEKVMFRYEVNQTITSTSIDVSLHGWAVRFLLRAFSINLTCVMNMPHWIRSNLLLYLHLLCVLCATISFPISHLQDKLIHHSICWHLHLKFIGQGLILAFSIVSIEFLYLLCSCDSVAIIWHMFLYHHINKLK